MNETEKRLDVEGIDRETLDEINAETDALFVEAGLGKNAPYTDEDVVDGMAILITALTRERMKSKSLLSELTRLKEENKKLSERVKELEKRQVQPLDGCRCKRCNPGLVDRVIFLCKECGNKRCPHATNHEYKCTNSNAPGQEGSDFSNDPHPIG